MKLQNENLTRKVMSTNNYEAFFFNDYYIKDVPLHCHNDFFEVYFFLSGNLTYHVESVQYSMAPGTVLLIPPNTLHRPVFFDKSVTYTRMFLWLSRTYLENLSSSCTNLVSCFESPSSKKVARLDPDTVQQIKSSFLKLTHLRDFYTWGADLMANSLVLNILIQVGTACMEKQMETPAFNQGSVFNSVVAYINENIEDIRSLEQVANHFFISKSYLARQFTQNLGISAYQYIIKKRMALAYQLLQQGAPLTAVYTQVGYRDYPTFYKAFRHEYGRGPQAYRKEALSTGSTGDNA